MSDFRLNACFKAALLIGLAWSAYPAIAAAPDGSPETPRLLVTPAVVAAILQSDAGDQTTPSLTTEQADAGPDAHQVECVAKVILHEAGPRPGAGQIAVAQVIRARVRSGRFAPDACGVVKQRGQFFDVDAYDPPRDTSAWSNAVAVATDALTGQGEEVAPGALFFRAAYAARGMNGRVRVAQIGGNVFYR